MMIHNTIVILIVLIVLLVIKIVLMKIQVKYISRQLWGIITNETKEIVKISLIDREIEELAEVVNLSIRACESICIESKQHERMLKQRISNISHDVRTPLASIHGYVQLMESESITEEQRKNYLQIVKNKSMNMNKLINSFFELSLIDSEKYAVEMKTIDLTALVNEAVLNFYSIMKERGIEPVLEIETKAILIESDQMACERIIQNIISNAVNYTRGTVYIGLEVTKNNKILFSVKNESDDISEEVENIFGRFYVVEKSRTRGNTGLGLYIVKVLAERIKVDVNAFMDNGIFTIRVIF